MGGKYHENANTIIDVCNNGDFEVEEGVEVEAPGPAMRPGDGYTWSRQVVLKITIILLEITIIIILISIIITIILITPIIKMIMVILTSLCSAPS